MNELNMYVIYNKPKDYPSNFVVRKWICFPGKVERGDLIGIADDLEKLPAVSPNRQTW